MKGDIGFIGLAVMGENLVLNMERNGFTVAVHNKTTATLDRFISGRGKGKRFIRAETLADLVAALERPRKVMLMIKAGSAVDQVIGSLLPLLSPGDTIIDGGNSNFNDTERRTKELAEKGILFVGSGISGGEEGALNGPSLMPGGSRDAWPALEGIFTAISAKAPDGAPCCAWMGSGGAGHFVKMVHNGIEYGDMQIVSEIYWLMKERLGLTHDRMSQVFAEWNLGKLDSYLIGITAEILAKKDADGSPLVERILDAAGQKGTGKWTGIAALDEGTPLTLIVESVFARCLSAQKDTRVEAAKLFPLQGDTKGGSGGKTSRLTEAEAETWIPRLRDALYAAKIVSYAQGFELLRLASVTHAWNLDFASIARIWRGGCIIRSVFLDRIADSFAAEPDLANLALSSYFSGELKAAETGWRETVGMAIASALPVPALASALSWFDGFRSANLPANLLQAQRDYFGAHTYERTDKPRGEVFHTDWTGRGGATTSGTYSL